MQKADIVLSILSEKSKRDSSYIFKRLYRNLFNPDFYMKAYINIYDRKENMFSGRINQKIDEFDMTIIEEIVRKMKNETYYPKSPGGIYSNNKEIQQVGNIFFMDILMQEVVRMLLEAIFEPVFTGTSHGFGKEKSLKAALYQVKSSYNGANWVIKGSIEKFPESIDHEILIELIGRKIEDGRFLELTRRFLNAVYPTSRSEAYKDFTEGMTQDIIGAILENIYMHEFDMFIEEIKMRYSSGSSNKINYTRYRDEFLLFVNGEKNLAVEIKGYMEEFLKNKLKLELCFENTYITNLKDENVLFLGYQIAKPKVNKANPEKDILEKKKAASGSINLIVPGEVITRELKPFMKNGKPVHRTDRLNLSVLEIINEYNLEIEALYDYYCLASDVSAKIGKFKYYHYYSLLKTIAAKEKSSVKKVIGKYGIDVELNNDKGTKKIAGVSYKTSRGIKTITYFNKPLKCIKTSTQAFIEV